MWHIQDGGSKMIEIKSLDAFKKVIENLDDKDIKYLVFGKTTYASFMIPSDPPNSLTVDLIIQSSVGNYYFSHEFRTLDVKSVESIKSYMDRVHIIEANIRSVNHEAIIE